MINTFRSIVLVWCTAYDTRWTHSKVTFIWYKMTAYRIVVNCVTLSSCSTVTCSGGQIHIHIYITQNPIARQVNYPYIHARSCNGRVYQSSTPQLTGTLTPSLVCMRPRAAVRVGGNRKNHVTTAWSGSLWPV